MRQSEIRAHYPGGVRAHHPEEIRAVADVGAQRADVVGARHGGNRGPRGSRSGYPDELRTPSDIGDPAAHRVPTAADIRIRPVVDDDRPTVGWLIAELWGSTSQVVHGTTYHPADLPGLIAERAGRLAGLLSYDIAGGVLEVVTINAMERRTGVGTLLIEAAVAAARHAGCAQIRLTTTNDNLDALRFYQRRGFRLVALRPGAVDRARQHKPEIPAVGDFGIPLSDELDLARPV